MSLKSQLLTYPGNVYIAMIGAFPVNYLDISTPPYNEELRDDDKPIFPTWGVYDIIPIKPSKFFSNLELEYSSSCIYKYKNEGKE